MGKLIFVLPLNFVNSTTIKKDTRARGRYINIKIENDTSSESWRFGTLKLDVQPDGRR